MNVTMLVCIIYIYIYIYIYIKNFVIIEIVHMNEKTGTDVSSEKEKVKESQSRSVTPSLDTPSGAWLGRHKFLNMNRVCFVEFWKIIPVFAKKKKRSCN